MLRLVNLSHPCNYLMDDLDDLLMSAYYPFQRSIQQKPWTATVELYGYRPEEITTKREESQGKQLLVVHARHEDGADFNELRRTVELPENIDVDKLQLHFSKKGILFMQAPYKQVEAKEKNKLLSIFDDFENPSFASLGKTQIVSDGQGGENFQVDFGVAGYKPDEISVNQCGNKIIVEAKHQSESDGSTSSKHMRREVTIPVGVQLDHFTSQLNESDGLLRLVAPYQRPKAPAPVEARKIPIQLTEAAVANPSNEKMES